ncbi:MAG: Gfo/Idh/MocA family oxidoreductase [Sedimentisphaerales bacterium]|nr:Gfo/Idh/MocA family oxidoreductase [Sedimentisphaerales bacterium]
MIKLAMTGAGGYAYELIKRICDLPGKMEIVAVTSNPARKSLGRSFCQNKGIPIYDDTDQMIKNIKGIADVIFIPAPIHKHFTLTTRCIDAGFDIFLEKPPVATIQDLDELTRYAFERGKKIPVAFQYLYSAIIQELKKRIVEGRYGEVKRVRGMAGWPRFDTYYNRSEWAGKLRINGEWVLDGTINNPLAHMLSDELYLACAEPGRMAQPASVEAELYHGHDIESEDTSSLRVITDKGVEILFNASLCSDARMDPSVIIECEKARIEYVGFSKAAITLETGVVEHITDNDEKRINMLVKLAEHYENGWHYPITLETCRPFTLVVNGAFESCGRPHPIDKEYLTCHEQNDHTGDTVKTVIKDIDNFLRTAHEKGKLFSEVGAPWAKKSGKFDLRGYKKFPTSAGFERV